MVIGKSAVKIMFFQIAFDDEMVVSVVEGAVDVICLYQDLGESLQHSCV